MTSLAEQLKKLAVPQTSIPVHFKKRPSILFKAKDAADIDRATFYEIGLSGFESLVQLDSRFSEFDKSLFDETSQHLERAVEDQQANAKLDQAINRFLILLSPYLNLNAAHKTLEWLICRFHINQYNVDGIMSLVLPYHDTNIFARIVQVISLKGKAERWNWLQPLKREGIPMSKIFLLSKASSDPSFLKFVCNLPVQAVQVHGDKSLCLKTLFAFYCTTVIGAVAQTTRVSELQLTHLLPSLLAGLASPHLDFAAAAFMVLGQLVTKVRLAPGIFAELFFKVAKCTQSHLYNEAALVLVVMAQSTPCPSVLPAALHLATTAQWFQAHLASLASSGVVVFPLVAALVSDCLLAMRTLDNVQLETVQEFVSKIVQEISYNNDEAESLLRLFSEIRQPESDWYHLILHQLEKSYPEAFDAVVKSDSEFLKLMPGYTARKFLFEELNHPVAEMRIRAILGIKRDKSILKVDWVQEALISRLEDDSPEVVSTVLQVADNFPPEALCRLVASVWHSRGALAPLALSRLRDTDPCQLMMLTLPFLLPADKEALTLSWAVINSSAIEGLELLDPIRQELAGGVTAESMRRAVWLYVMQPPEAATTAQLIEASAQLEPLGTVYQLIGLVLAASSLPPRPSPSDLQPVLQLVRRYNSSPQITSVILEEFNEENFASNVAVCQKRKLPYQGSLYALSAIIDNIKNILVLPDGEFLCDVQDPNIMLVIDVFKIALEMTKSKNKNIRKAYKKFALNIFDTVCDGGEQQARLLSSIAAGRPDLAAECLTRLGVSVEAGLDVPERAVVPALLVGLRSEQAVTRERAAHLLQALTARLALPTHHRLLHQLADHIEEMVVDCEQVNVALYLSLSPDPAVRSLLDKPIQKDLARSLSSLMDDMLAPETPASVLAVLLQALDQVHSKELLERLVPVAMRVLGHLAQSEGAAELEVLSAVVRRLSAAVMSAPAAWTLMQTCLSGPPAPAMLALAQIDRELMACLSRDRQQQLVALMISCVVESDDSRVASAAASAFKRITLDAGVVAPLLEPMRDATHTEPASSTKKKGWKLAAAPSLQLLTTPAWRQGLCLLEFIQDKKKLENLQLLVPRLFEIINKCLQFEEQSPVEYTKQVVLTALLHCCERQPEACREGGAEGQVDLVVDCMRASQNPQTHHHALLLLTHLASVNQDRVLHSIMPIFTFMGSSVLRQDDSYSFQIISKIIETIVPVLIKKGEEGGMELSDEVVCVLRVFAGALLDIPEHRRTALYVRLLQTLGDGQYLWAFLALVFESHVLNNTPVKEPGAVPARLDVALRLCAQFTPATVLQACAHLMRYLCALPIYKGDKQLEEFRKSRECALFDVVRATDKQLRHYTYTTATFLSLLLSSKHFLRIVASLSIEEVQDLRDIYQEIFQGILLYTQTVSKQADKSVGLPSAKYWKSMLNVCFDILSKTNALLPADLFLGVVSGLLGHKLGTLRVKALDLLNWRLQQAHPMAAQGLLALAPRLLALFADLEPLARQTALLSVKLMARQLAAEHPQEFQPMLIAAADLLRAREEASSEPVLASAVLCVGELSHCLGPHAVPHLPAFMPDIIKILKNSTTAAASELVVQSAVSALFKIVDALASFLSPYLSRLLHHLCVLSCSPSHADNTKMQPVLLKVKAIRQKLSAEVPMRVLLPAVTTCYSKLVRTQVEALPPLFSILAEAFKSAQDLSPELSAFFLTALDFRSQASSREQIDLVEPAVISTILALVLKLSESLFRPFYYKVFDWAFQHDASKHRSITFYRLTFKMADSLKGLFVSFASYFLKNAASLLVENNVAKRDTEVGSSLSEDESEELLCSVLETLHSVFLHDAGHFVNKERFDTLMQPLVDQLENKVGAWKERTTALVIPCLTQMALSAADDTLWKQLNYQILLKTRHDSPQVRIGGVLAVGEIAKTLGEEFLPLLPETVPFLAELLEDEDESVEKTSQRVVQELEAALGEQISKYF